MAERIGDIELARHMLRYFGWRRAAELLGVCTIAAMMGVDPDDEPEVNMGRVTWYRVRRDLKLFGVYLRTMGWEVDEVTPEMLAHLRLVA